MNIDSAHFSMAGRTKADRLAIPSFTDCELRIHIGEFGFAQIDLWQKAGTGSQRGDFGMMASISISRPSEMRALGDALMKLADAAEAMGK